MPKAYGAMALGLGGFLGSLLGAGWWLGQTPPTGLRLRIDGDAATLEGADRPRAVATHWTGPGLGRRAWSVARASGTTTVFWPRYHGPWVAEGACLAQLTVGQALLGLTGPDGQPGLATVVASRVTAALAATSVVGVGKFVRLADVQLSWAEARLAPDDVARFGAGLPAAYLRIAAVADFARVTVPVVMWLAPTPGSQGLALTWRLDLRLQFASAWLTWAAAKLGANAVAGRWLERELSSHLVTLLAPPPPLELAPGVVLQLAYCGAPPRIVHQQHAALGLTLRPVSPGPQVPALPLPSYGPWHAATAANPHALGLELGLDALNGLLVELWRQGWLQQQLDALSVPARFAETPLVARYLSLRLANLRLALPPTLAPTPEGLRWRVSLALDLFDTTLPARRVPAQAWLEAAITMDVQRAEPTVAVEAFDLQCEVAAGLHAPCYALVAAAVRDAARELTPALTEALRQALHRALTVKLELAGLTLTTSAPRFEFVGQGPARGVRVGVRPRVE